MNGQYLWQCVVKDDGRTTVHPSSVSCCTDRGPLCRLAEGMKLGGPSVLSAGCRVVEAGKLFGQI